MSFEMRIKNTLENGQPSACPYIDMTKEELQYYHGCGWVIAAEQHGFIYDLIYIVNEMILDNKVPPENIYPCVKDIINKIPLHNSEGVKFWLCMASCSQLCDPLEIADYNLDLIIDKICLEAEKCRKEMDNFINS